MRRGLQALAVGCALVATRVLAQDGVVRVQAVVVYASGEEGKIDGSLTAMHSALSTKAKYLTLRKLSAQRLDLSRKPSKIKLAHDITAEISLVSMRDNVAQVLAKVPPLEAIYQLAKGKSLYIQAGKMDAGDLWLVLSDPRSL